MDFYFFGPEELIDQLIDNKFKGILFTYNTDQGDFFSITSRIAKEDSDFKYMVAIRPYVISPQYLSMIFTAFSKMKLNNLKVNLILGHIKDNEKNYGGVLGLISDQSSNIDRSNYLIEYIDCLTDLNKKNSPKFPIVDFYVSISNDFVFNAAKNNKNKMIMGYYEYIKNIDNTKKENIMVYLGPVIRDTQKELKKVKREYLQIKKDVTIYCTEEELKQMINNLKENGVKEILLFAWPEEESQRIFDFVKKYKTNRLEIQQ
jgi:hypothetical protein